MRQTLSMGRWQAFGCGGDILPMAVTAQRRQHHAWMPAVLPLAVSTATPGDPDPVLTGSTLSGCIPHEVHYVLLTKGIIEQFHAISGRRWVCSIHTAGSGRLVLKHLSAASGCLVQLQCSMPKARGVACGASAVEVTTHTSWLPASTFYCRLRPPPHYVHTKPTRHIVAGCL